MDQRGRGVGTLVERRRNKAGEGGGGRLRLHQVLLVTFWPSIQPSSFRPCRNAAAMWMNGISDDPLRRKPITGIAGCCARAANGHVAVPPSSEMRERRFTSSTRGFTPSRSNHRTSAAHSAARSALSPSGHQMLGANLKSSESDCCGRPAAHRRPSTIVICSSLPPSARLAGQMPRSSFSVASKILSSATTDRTGQRRRSIAISCSPRHRTRPRPAQGSHIPRSGYANCGRAR
jgi:hypothetical protein